MIRYDGLTKFFIIGKHFNYNTGEFDDTKFVLRRWGNTMIEAQPRYGKSVVAKDLTIKISKYRKVVVFDYGGEWQYNIIKYNLRSPFPDRMVGHKVLKDFTFNILSFNSKEDFASMGFDSIWAAIVCDLINQTKNLHKGDISAITEMLAELPVKGSLYKGFNIKYGTDLAGNINSATKTAIITRWMIIRNYFWQGPEDKRQIFDFAQMLKLYDHLIIELTSVDDLFDVGMKRAYCGKILEKMFPAFIECKPMMVFEEARMLFPNYSGEIALSSNVQIYNVVTHAPKLGVVCLFIVQHENQLYQPILENIHARITGRVQVAPEWLKKIYKHTRLEYDPEHNVREFLYLDVKSDPHNPTYIKFRPGVPCCHFNSDR